MAIHIFSTWVSRVLPTSYYIPTAAAMCLFYSLQFIANGRKNPRDRDMHGRVVLVTGAFTPLGLTLMHEFAQRGAQIVALTPSLADPVVEELISAIRTVTSNELIFAEECDLSSPASIRAFCKQFLATTASGPSSSIPGAPRDPPRLDAIVLAHEYTHIGVLWTRGKDARRMESDRRLEGGLASFLLMTLLLPCLIKAPNDRDIRVVSVVNPLYAASVPTYMPPLAPPKPDANEAAGSQSKPPSSPPSTDGVPEPAQPTTPLQSQLAQMALSSISSREGERALRTILLMRHLQRVVDALSAQSTKPVLGTSDAETVEVKKSKTSNILAVSVAPGFSRPQTMGAYLCASRESEDYSRFGFFLYLLLFPVICLFSKSSTGAAQTVLYALFAPTPRTRITEDPPEPSTKQTAGSNPEPIPRIQGGILYRECAVTRLPGRGVALMEAEGIGRAVWEEMERGVEIWEKSEGEVLREMAKEVEKEGEEKAKGSRPEKGKSKDE
ncbi:hypothetical protein FS749_001973 [Ceratobasidium sp. UAMH 11750]|nr:hypothetical protein FS749_001973 [Ceratobasidium sp. UAMH 11750]